MWQKLNSGEKKNGESLTQKKLLSWGGKRKWKDHVASQRPCLSASVSRRFLDEAYLIPFYIYAPLSSNSFMNKINYFSKQKLILFFSAWLTQDLSAKSHLKTKLNWFSPPGLPGFFPAFFAWVLFFFLTISIQRPLVQSYFNPMWMTWI